MLTTPATSSQVFASVWRPALLHLPAKMTSLPSDVLGIAIGAQESGYRARVQMNNGPAHSFWQFEEGGGVHGVMHHPASHDFAQEMCASSSVPFDPHLVWLTMATNDALGAQFARLLLWTSTEALPAIGDIDGAWDYYTRLWRPGKPDRDRWSLSYSQAVAAVRGT